MKTSKDKNIFFDKAYFLFQIKDLSKKTIIYVGISIYLFLILTFSLFIPLISDMSSMSIYTNPITSIFLVFIIAIVSCLIAVELFRTSIDDGTELLVVSKPLSRIEIIVVKLSIFLIYIFSISILSSLFATFTFVDKNTYLYDNLKIIGGNFVATLICGLLFGGITTIISIYHRKIISMLVTISLAFFLMIYSLLATFVVSNPIKVMEKSTSSIMPISLLNFDSNLENIKVIQGAIPNTVSEKRDVREIWNDLKDKSNYIEAGMFDIGAQLSSIYTLAIPANDSMQVLQNIAAFNSPLDLKFKDYNLKNSFYIPLRFVEESKLLDSGLSELEGEPIELFPYKKETSFLKGSTRKYNEVINYSYQSIINNKIDSTFWESTWEKYGDLINDQIDLELETHHIIANSTITNQTKITDEDLNISYPKSGISKVDYWSTETSIAKPSSLLLTYIADEMNLTENNIVDFIKKMNLLVYSALSKLKNESQNISIFNILDITRDIHPNLKIKNIFPNFDSNNDEWITSLKQLVKKYLNMDLTGETTIKSIVDKINENKDAKEYFAQKSSTRNEFRAILELLGIHVETIIDSTEFNQINTSENYNFELILSRFIRTQSTFFNWYYDDKSKNNITINELLQMGQGKNKNATKLHFGAATSLAPEKYLENFKSSYAINTIDRNILIPTWITISIIFFCIGMLMYSKRDFA